MPSRSHSLAPRDSSKTIWLQEEFWCQMVRQHLKVFHCIVHPTAEGPPSAIFSCGLLFSCVYSILIYKLKIGVVGLLIIHIGGQSLGELGASLLKGPF
jgi:hypothetical protein